jgi:hypothetical protein
MNTPTAETKTVKTASGTWLAQGLRARVRAIGLDRLRHLVIGLGFRFRVRVRVRARAIGLDRLRQLLTVSHTHQLTYASTRLLVLP